VVAVRWRTGGWPVPNKYGPWRGPPARCGDGRKAWRSWGWWEHLGTAQAEQHYQGALDAARKRGDRREIGLGLNDVGIAAYYQGDYARARRFEEEALAVRIEMGDKAGEATVLNNLALTAAAVGEFTLTRSLLERTLQLSEEMGDREVPLFRSDDVSWACSEARTLMEEAARRYQDLGDGRGLASVSRLGWIALAENQPRALVPPNGR
jgi:tetratricopeptide (TPR) repeat protein